jgi:hypothetical protein
MVNQPNLPIPPVISPDKTRCIQLQIPDDETWITNFVGLLSIPTFWFNWQRTGDTSGKRCADVWKSLFDVIDWSDMSCCCDQPPAIYRYGEGGVYERSTDGGLTWTPAPNYDYRNTSTVFPNPADLGISTTKCQAADGVVATINDEIVQSLNESFAAAQILALIAAVLLAVLTAGSLLALTPLITAIGAAIIDVGVTATQAAFTSDVWDRLRCNIYCNMTDDYQMTDDGFAAVLAKIVTAESGIVETVLYGIINAAGKVGITNMMRSNKGSAAADCSDCGCSETCVDNFMVTFGDLVERDDTSITATATQIPDDGRWAITLYTGDINLCCTLVSADIVGIHFGSVTPFAKDCGHDDLFTGIIVGHCVNTVLHLGASGDGAYTMKFTFSDCP